MFTIFIIILVISFLNSFTTNTQVPRDYSDEYYESNDGGF